MKLEKLKKLVSLGLAVSLILSIGAPAFAQGQDKDRIKSKKSTDKKAKHGTIEIKNDTGKDCNDLHLVWRPSQPTIEGITDTTTKKDPFPSGYVHTPPNGHSDHQDDFGRGKNDGEVKDGSTVEIKIAWTGEMPELVGFAWTLNGEIQSRAKDQARQTPEIKGKDADAARKAAAKKAKDEEEKAKKEPAKKKKMSIGPGSDPFQRSIQTPEGTLKVYLPSDLVAGDTITGTVVAVPNGKTTEERQKNEDTLEGYVLDLGGKEISAKTQSFDWLVPAAGVFGMTLLNGTQDGTRVMPVLAGPPMPDPVGTGAEWPICGQSGRTIAIRGAFDAKTPTEVTIGGQRLRVLAESPRQAIVEMPRGLVGPQGIEIREDGKTIGKGNIGVVRVSLSAPKTNLLKGESTQVKVEVSGLMGLTAAGDRLEVYFDPAYCAVENNTPEIIQFGPTGGSGSNGSTSIPMDSFSLSVAPMLPMGAVPIRIDANNVSPEGVYVQWIPITAKRAGTFSISAWFMGGEDYDRTSGPRSDLSKR